MKGVAFSKINGQLIKNNKIMQFSELDKLIHYLYYWDFFHLHYVFASG